MEFTAFKMDALGNDFVIIDQRLKDLRLSKDQIIKICDRNFVGCDQLIYIKKNRIIDASLEFYNSDGSSSGACGNGTRCVAYLLSKENNKNEIEVWTSSGNLQSKIYEEKIVETKIGIPKTNWNEIPLNKELETKNLKIKILDNNNNEFIGGTAVNVGNTHVIFFMNYIDRFDIKKIGPEIENSKLFPERCNVTLAKIIRDNHIKIKVWERGAGLTKACGTAACATAYAAKLNGMEKSKINIEFSLGILSIEIDSKNTIYMKGPVSEIEEITVKI